MIDFYNEGLVMLDYALFALFALLTVVGIAVMAMLPRD